MTRIFLIVAVIVGIGIDGFFAVVNFYPVAPQPGAGPKRFVILQLDEVQGAWFQANILDDFNAETNANVQLVRVAEEEQLQAAVAKYGKDAILVALPVTQLGHAIDEKLVRPFTDVASATKIAADFGDLGDKLMAPGKVGAKQYFLPRMTVLDVAVFRISKVRDAVLHWSVLRPRIDAALARLNGHGLPTDYELSPSPDHWTSYDIFVMAYFWAYRSYGGQPAQPRVAHRTGDESDGQKDIAAALYRMGATDATFGTFTSPAARDFFQWESLFRAEGLYPKAMLTAEPFDDEAALAGLTSGALFLAPIDSMEAFNLHGGSHANALAHVDDPGDLEFASLPRGASLALDPKGYVMREGTSFSFREDWLWALPAASTTPDLGYKLVQFMWQPDIHARECEALGMLPTHPQVVSERVSRFRLDWMAHVFAAGLSQGGESVPPALIGKGLGSTYAQLWAKIVAGEVPMSEAEIATALAAPPAPKALVVADVTAPTTAKPDDTADEDTTPPPVESEDWETDVVLVSRDAGVDPPRPDAQQKGHP